MDSTDTSGTLRITIAVVVGLATMGYGAYSYSAQSSAMDSPVEVNATITATAIEEHSKKGGTTYQPRATFNYTYQGQAYTSSNVYPAGVLRELGSREKAKAKLKGYEPGSTVTAYVPPESPGKAFLMDESSNKPMIITGLGGLVVLGGIRSFLTG